MTRIGMRKHWRVPFVGQGEHSECGLAAAAMMLGTFGRPVPLDELRHRYGVPRGGLSLANIAMVMSDSGLTSCGITIPSAESLKNIGVPCILYWDDDHFVVLERYACGRFHILDPVSGRCSYTLAEIALHCSGAALVPQPPVEVRKASGVRRRSVTTRVLMHFFRHNILYVALALMLSLAIQGVTLIVPAGTSYLVDHGALATQNGFIPLIVALLCVSLFVYYAVNALSTLAFTKLQVKFSRYLSSEYMAGALKRDFPFFVNRSGGDLIYRANLVMAIVQIVAGSLPSTVVSIIFLIIYLAMMLVYSVPLTLMTLGICLAVLVISVVYSARSKILIEHMTAAQSDVQRSFIETFSGIETVKSLNLEQRCYDQWSGRMETQLKYQMRQGRLSALLSSLSSALVFVLPLCVVAFGMSFVGHGLLPLGTVVGFMSLASAFVTPFSNLVGIISQVIALSTYMRKVCEIIPDETGENHSAADTSNAASKADAPKKELKLLKAAHVDYSYTVFSPPIVTGIDLDIHAGEKIALVGATGSGKSTVLKLLAGLLEPTQGQITINGSNQSIFKLSSSWKTRKLAYVHQEPTVFNETLYDNIALHREWLEPDDIVRACNVACIDGRMMNPNMGLNTMISERGLNLSGGQRQKISIARAVAGNPDFLLMDEPTSALDNETERRVMTALLQSPCACVVVAHRLSAIREFDRIYVMDNGRIVEHGTHRQLMAANGLYTRLYREPMQ